MILNEKRVKMHGVTLEPSTVAALEEGDNWLTGYHPLMLPQSKEWLVNSHSIFQLQLRTWPQNTANEIL